MRDKATRTHILSLTYKPKIEAVFSGECRQTIRRARDGRPKRIGDKLILHEWEGKPYRSKWGRRLDETISDVLLLMLNGPYAHIGHETDTLGNSANDKELDELARRDFIDPPTGEHLIKTLSKLNGNSQIGVNGITFWEVIRW